MDLPITASAGNASASVEVRRPSWADMKKYYPAKSITTQILYDQMIGGTLKKLYDHKAYRNTCAVRMSYALNRSGLKLGNAPSDGGGQQGGDGYTYWIRVKDLRRYLEKRFKGADFELKLPVVPVALLSNMRDFDNKYRERVELAKKWMESHLRNRSGIVVFDVAGWGDASGHFTLWDCQTRTLAYAAPHDNPGNELYYFWLTDVREDLLETVNTQVTSVKFWELK